MALSARHKSAFCCSMPKRCAEPPSPHVPNGPSTLEGLLCPPADYARILEDKLCSDVVETLKKCGLVVTTSYSGSGAFECAVRSTFDSESQVCPKIKITFYSASESCRAARAALLSHSGDTRPLHLFGDILDRLPQACCNFTLSGGLVVVAPVSRFAGSSNPRPHSCQSA